MAKYLQLEKLKTDLSDTSTLFINQDDILLIDEQTMQNKVTAQVEQVRRVVLIGYPSYSFYTRTTLTAFEAQLKAIDFTGGIGTGSSCLVPGVLDIVSIVSSFPTVKLIRVRNNTLTESEPHLVNLNYLYFAEAVPFVDEVTGVPVRAFTLALKGAPYELFKAKISLGELQAVLDPTQI